jgi:phage/plasmid primase-like uncharacterized protein
MMLDDAHNNLTEAINQADLPAIVSELYPDSGARPSSKHRAKAVWRGGDGDSVAFWRGSNGAWLASDFGQGEHYNAYKFLTDVAGLSKGDAARMLLEHTGLSHQPNRKTYQAKRQPKPEISPVDRTPKVAKADIGQWRKLATSGQSSYLDRKGAAGVTCEAVRFGSNRVGILMSVATEAGTLEPTSVQWIYDDGAKLFAKGGSTRGALALVGAKTLADLSGHVYLCEGYATAVSIHKATGCPVVVAFTANNLEHVARSIKKHCKKITVTIAADNDAYHLPKKGNPGLEKAHKTALTFGYKVASPVFDDATTKPTDYNDLHTLCGLPEVTRQLQPQDPSNKIAFAKDLRQLDKKLHKIQASRGRYLPKLEHLPDGVNLIKAPQGTGKTYAMKDLIARYRALGLRILYITHRVSLARDAARRLDLDHYEDVGEHIRTVSGLTVCINSLPRLIDEKGNLDSFDIVLLDESEQQLKALNGSHIKGKNAVLDTLEHFVRRAQKLVCLDADLGVMTHRMLQHWRPRERRHYITHHCFVGEGRTLQLHKSLDDIYGLLEQNSDPVMIVTNHAREAEMVHAFLQSLGKTGRLITGDTSASEAAFLADIDRNCQGLDYLVCSPSVSTGVSLESGYFTRVVGMFFADIGLASDAMQALWRVRTMATYDLWIDPSIRSDFVDLTARDTTTREHEKRLLDRALPTKDNATYEDLRRTSEALTRHSQAAYRLDFLRLATLQGFDVGFAVSTGEHKGKRKKARELADAAYVESVLFDDSKADTLATIKDFYKLTDDNPEAVRPWVVVDDRGRYRKRVTRLETALANNDHMHKVVDDYLEQTEMTADMPFVASLRELNRKVLEVVGFGEAARAWQSGDVDQLALTRYSKDTLADFVVWCETNREWLAGLVAMPSPDKLAANPVRFISSRLKALGLKQKRVGKNKDGQYALEVESLKVACETLQRRGTLSTEIEDYQKVSPEDAPPEDPPEDPQPRRVKLPVTPATPEGWQYSHTLILPNGAQRHVWTQ